MSDVKRWWVDASEAINTEVYPANPSDAGNLYLRFVLEGDYNEDREGWQDSWLAMNERLTRAERELDRYKHALWEANGYRIQEGKDPVKLAPSESMTGVGK